MALYTRPGLLEISNESMHKSEAEYLNEPSFKVNLVAAPELVQLFEKHGITRRGRYTWSLANNGPRNREVFQDFYREYSEKFTPYTLHAGESLNNLENTYSSFYIQNNAVEFSQPLAMSHSYLDTTNVRRVISTNTRSFFGATTVDRVDRNLFNSPINYDYRQAFIDDTGIADRWGQNSLKFKNKIIRETVSPFALTMTLKNNVLYFRLKKSSPEHFQTEVQNTTFSFLEYISGIEYVVITPSEKMLNISEVSKVLYATNKMFDKNIFTKDSQDLIKFISQKIKNSLFVNSVPGRPSSVNVMNPTSKILNLKVSQFKKNGEKSLRPKKNTKIKAYESKSLSLLEALDLSDSNDSLELVVHPSLIDLKNMTNAQDYDKEERLYKYQRKAVGLQLSTERGFLNSLDTGIGKSIVQLTAMRERSKTVENYRGLIVCQSNTKKQWKEYMQDDTWFPEAEVVIVDSGKTTKNLVEGLSKTGPVVVIATFNMVAQITEILEERAALSEALSNMKTDSEIRQFFSDKKVQDSEKTLSVSDLIVDVLWHDICADEATSIRNSVSSKQAQALWHLRNNSDRGVALTATPFNKSIDDIARLLEWVRNEKHMFYGNKLSNRYDQENITEENAKEIFDSLYPMVFRFTKEEAQAQEKDKIKIPKELAPETLLLKPSAAELALSNACEYELKRIITELETALDNYAAKTDEEKAEVDAARAELNEAHGHWMAGTNVARMATSNPASILKSKSVAAQLLVGQGLVENAMHDTPTKKKVLMEKVLQDVSQGEQILVFTDFVDVANSLAKDFENIGVRAGVFGGTNLKKRDENRIAFQKEELDVLICTKAAERGLTLHKASVAYHYDMSWTLEPLLQKAGRNARVGSANKEVRTVFLILEGTIEEKVVDKVFTQGTMSTMVLDQSRGVKIADTTTGKLMGGLMKASANINSRKGAVEFGKALLGM